MSRNILFALFMFLSCNGIGQEPIIDTEPLYMPPIKHDETIESSETYDIHGRVSSYRAVRYWGKYQPDGSVKLVRTDTLTFWCDYGLATPRNYEWWKEK